MIAIIPALDFVRGLCGTYTANDSDAKLRIWPCGYGVALDAGDGKKTQFVGVVGAHGTSVECFAQVGLPNVMRFKGDLTSANAIQFVCEDVPFTMSLAREPEGVQMAISISGDEKAKHTFRLA